ncbi:MAG: peptidylprolyl isomerase, partial [Planctomycetota bacterium]
TEQYRAGLARQRLLEAQWAGKIDVNDAAAKTYYDRNTKEFESPEQVRASHILIKPQVTDPNSDPNVAKVAARAKAEKLVGEIKDGADFAELAKANPGDPGSAAKGGDLGFFPRGKMVKPFEEAAFAMQPGEVSDIVESRFGYHIIKVTERKEASVTPFEEAKAGIVAKLAGEQKAKIARAYINSLKDKATIVYAAADEPNAPEPAPVAPAVSATPADANAN